MSFRYEVIRKKEKAVSKTMDADEILHVLVEGDNLISGAKDLEQQFGDLSTIEQDLVTLASAIYAADRASQRGEREDYPRRISLEVSLHNVDRFYPMVPLLTRILRELSQDGWAIKLRQTRAKPMWGSQNDGDCIDSTKKGCVLLFSGGLDSLAAAVEFGSQMPLQLVSHVTRNQVTDRAQSELAKILCAKGMVVAHRKIFVSSRDGGPTGLEHDLEPSQRTRSVVFMALGAIVARRTGFSKILYMAENGQMAIHLPLSGGRIGAFSTHTAHPSVLVKMKSFLSSVLGIPIDLINPYIYQTKGEVVARVFKGLPDGLPISTSCWRNARVNSKGINHCGDCVPCLVRRIAIESNGRDTTKYRRDLFAENIGVLGEDDDGRRNFADITEFVVRFSKHSNKELFDEFPDLICGDFDAGQVIDMYQRFGKEARKVLSGYPQLKAFLA